MRACPREFTHRISHVARSASFALLYPAMSSVGYGVTVGECVVSVYGGLRGAVGLALALTVRLDPNINDVIGEKVLFHCAGIVILTVRCWEKCSTELLRSL